MAKANMKFFTSLGIVLFFSMNSQGAEFVAREMPGGGKYFSDKLVIANEYDAQPYLINRASSGIAVSGVASVDDLCLRHSVVRIEPFYSGKLRIPTLSREVSRMYIFTLSEGRDARAILDYFAADPNIEFAELYPAPEPCYIPDDPDIDQQWHLDRVDAFEAWDVVRGDTTRHSVVGIVDTGVYWFHPDLWANMWINAPEDLNQNDSLDAGDINDIDDDGNGFIDDVVGWDMGQNDNNPAENAPTHGTHVAGCASEVTDNEIGGAGIGFSARTMAVKGSNASGQLTAVWQGITYAADNGANIINCSWGSPIYSQAGQNMIYALREDGILMVAAAGSNGDTTRIYPAAYEGVIAVGSTDQSDHLASFSGYGAWVDICAPGEGIYATWGPSSYTQLSGSSMSSPMACGLAALIRAWLPNLSAGAVETLIISTADNIDSLNPAIPDSLVPPRLNCTNWLAIMSADEPGLPLQFILLSNYPNPFNAATTIRYILPAAADVQVDVLDILGRNIDLLIDSRQEVGIHSVNWSPGNSPSGVYFYKIRANGIVGSRPMILLK